MNALFPSAKALVPFVSVENMMRLIHHVGLETMLRELARSGLPPLGKF
jgi:ornithine cyclodeaminase